MFYKNAVLLIILHTLNIAYIFSFSIPFYPSKSLLNSTTSIEILDTLKNCIKYSFIDIGEPIQKLPIILTSHDYSNIIMKDSCPIKSNYDFSSSKNVKIFCEKNNVHYFYINDNISFDDKNKNILMTFIHYNQSNKQENTCAYIGTQFIKQDEKEKNTTINLFLQLKKMNLINKLIYYFNYTSNNIMMNIGIEPNEIDSKIYSQKNMTEIDVDFILDHEKKNEFTERFSWNLNISKVFYFKKIPLESSFDPFVEVSRKNTRKVNFFQALLFPEYELIKGPFEYQEKIEEDFFEPLIREKLCKKVNFERKYFFVCTKQSKYLLQKTFPTLYFYHKKINYMFELTYDDLFLEHNDYIIFLIYFDYFQIELFRGAFLSEWYFGKPFLKKYCFSFDLDKGKIRFYRENIVKSQSNKKLKKKNLSSGINKIYYPLGIILFVLFIVIFAFVLERISKRRKRIDNSLIDYESKSD
jgi:hypothetical protein